MIERRPGALRSAGASGAAACALAAWLLLGGVAGVPGALAEEEGDSDSEEEAEAGGRDEVEEESEEEGAAAGARGGAVDNDVLGGLDADEGESHGEEGEESAADDDVDDATIAAAIAEMTDIYLTMDSRRDPLERIIIDGSRAEIWFLQAMRGTPAEVEQIRCQAYRWLFFGRLTRSKGAKEVFLKFSKIQEIRLSFFTLETRIEPDGRRGYRQARKADPAMEVTLSREAVIGLDMAKLRQRLGGEGCAAEGERVVDKKWYARQGEKQEEKPEEKQEEVQEEKPEGWQ